MRFFLYAFVIALMALLLSSCVCKGSCSTDIGYQRVNTSPVYRADDGQMYMLKHKSSVILSTDKQSGRAELGEILYVFNGEQNKWFELSRVTDSEFNIHRDQALEYNNARVQAIYNVIIMLRGSRHVNVEQYVVFDGNKSYVKNVETDETVKIIVLPTVDDISAATGWDLDNSAIHYRPYRNKQLAWQQGFTASVCVGKKHGFVYENKKQCTDVYFFKLKKENQAWEITSLISIREAGWGSDEISTTGSYIHQTFRSLDGKVTACVITLEGGVRARKCFVDRNGQLKLETFFGEIYTEGFERVSREYPPNYTLDEKGNMHVFYNKQADIDSFNYDYFYWAYYSKDNPTVPLYQQKIPWYKK